ncbi:MAG: patatin-like phospholipase family protein [Pseudomonadota bacterium]
MSTPNRKRINLALQGGGAHGAFTWGVLDRILEDDRVEIASMSGTSAGALNGAAVKSGIVKGGSETARENLDWLWGQVGAINDMRLASWMTATGPGPGIVAKSLEYSLPFSVIDGATRMFSPYTYGPFYQNPLQRIVERFEYDAVCADGGPQFHVCATNVRSGKIRVFTGDEISTNVILASACLPTMFQAVEFTDPKTGKMEAFWDGGYTGNPALFPLFHEDLPRDIVIVNINPLHREELPLTAQAIQNRINEISFNSSLLREMRAISFVKRLIEDGRMERDKMRDPLMHMIADDGLMNELSVATKLVPSAYILATLKDAGRAAAQSFLKDNFDALGETDTVDLEAMFA